MKRGVYIDRKLNLRAGEIEVVAEEIDVRSQRVRSAPVTWEIASIDHTGGFPRTGGASDNITDSGE